MQKEQIEVKEVAESYIGKREIKGNLGFTDKSFEKKMSDIGWKTTHAWCCYFTELVWSEVFDSVKGMRKKIDNLFSGSATKTFKQFESAGWNIGKVPEVGAVVIWCSVRNGVKSWKGHAGIVTGVNDSYFETIEGNTNGGGSREGEIVASKKRKYRYSVNNGLELVGFIYPLNVSAGVPFNNKTEGDNFRTWINSYHIEYARKIDLDKSGSFYNSFIRKAWNDYGEEYLKRFE
jgi:surface antigen